MSYKDIGRKIRLVKLNTYDELTVVECLAIDAYCCSPDPIVSDILCSQIFVRIQVTQYPDLCMGPTVD